MVGWKAGEGGPRQGSDLKKIYSLSFVGCSRTHSALFPSTVSQNPKTSIRHCCCLLFRTPHCFCLLFLGSTPNFLSVLMLLLLPAPHSALFLFTVSSHSALFLFTVSSNPLQIFYRYCCTLLLPLSHSALFLFTVSSYSALSLFTAFTLYLPA
jgi:hypothetical protein